MEFKRVAVFYDIRDDNRRKRFSDFLKDIGLERVQMSGFMGCIREDLIERLKDKCKEFEEDTIHIIWLYKCGKDIVETFGFAHIPEDEDIYTL